MKLDEVLKKIEKVEGELDYVFDNYSGCDWCCGGGDEIVAELELELDRLGEIAQRLKGVRD